MRKSCSYCKESGHRRNKCPKLKEARKCGQGDADADAGADEVDESESGDEKEEKVEEKVVEVKAVKDAKETKRDRRRGERTTAVEKEIEEREVVTKQPVRPVQSPPRATRAQEVLRKQPLRGDKNTEEKKINEQVRQSHVCSMRWIGRRIMCSKGGVPHPPPAQDEETVKSKVQKEVAKAHAGGLPTAFKIHFDPINYIELGGDVGHEEGGMYADQYFREEVIRFKVRKGVKPGGELTLRGEDVVV